MEARVSFASSALTCTVNAPVCTQKSLIVLEVVVVAGLVSAGLEAATVVAVVVAGLDVAVVVVVAGVVVVVLAGVETAAGLEEAVEGVS